MTMWCTDAGLVYSDSDHAQPLNEIPRSDRRSCRDLQPFFPLQGQKSMNDRSRRLREHEIFEGSNQGSVPLAAVEHHKRRATNRHNYPQSLATGVLG